METGGRAGQAGRSRPNPLWPGVVGRPSCHGVKEVSLSLGLQGEGWRQDLKVQNSC